MKKKKPLKEYIEKTKDKEMTIEEPPYSEGFIALLDVLKEYEKRISNLEKTVLSLEAEITLELKKIKKGN